jgi:hypothetical protein
MAAGNRKSLSSLIGTPDTAPTPAATRPDRPDSSAMPARQPAPEPAQQAPAASAEKVTTRSWYMPKSSADQLAALVDDVHFATRLPKHLIMGALVNVLGRHRDEVEAEAREVAGQ